MKFIVSRKSLSLTESKKPCEEAVEEDLTALDYRTVPSLEEAAGKIWYKDWLNSGENHREENGMVVCDKKAKTSQWVVELNTLDDLIAFQCGHGTIVLSDSASFKGVNKEIIIQ